MKTSRSGTVAVNLVGLMAAGLGAICQGQTTNFIVDQLDTDTSGFFGNLSWGTAVPAITWDSAVNKTTTLGPNNAGSGSAHWSIDWSASPAGDQVMVNRRFPNSAVLNLVNYTNVSFDIRFDPASATDGAGRFGAVEVDWTPQSDGWPSTSAGSSIFVATNTGWLHVEIPFDASSNPKLAAVTYVGFKIQRSRTGPALNGTTLFWLDNIILHARSTVIPPPGLSVAAVRTPPGLMVVASGGGNEYKRGMIRTLDPVLGAPYYSWVGKGSAPVTYSMTITNYPVDHYFLQSQIFLVPNGGNDSSIDYNAASVVALDIRNLPDGTATGAFRYKTNHMYANASDYVPAVLICSNGVLGTWSLTFLNDTNVTVKAPNGTTTNFALPSDVPTQFYDPVSVYFGNQENGPANAGQAATYSNVKVTGTLSSPDINDSFNRQDLNPDPLNATWQVVCDVPTCVFLLHSDDKFWLNWTLPASGYSVESSPSLAPGSFTLNPQLTNVINTTVGNRMAVPQSSLPASGTGFFRLSKPAP